MIEINNKWAIGADALNIILYHRGKSKIEGKESKWIASGFFSTLHNALTELVNQEVRDTDLASLKAVISKLDEIEKLIKGLPNITTSDLGGKPE